MYLQLDPQNPSWDDVSYIAKTLKKGAVAVMPTDSVYAFVGLYGNQRAMETLASLKGVKLKQAKFSLLFKDIQSTNEYLRPLSRSQFKCLTKNTPGPFTFILPCAQKVSKKLGGGRETIGVRIADLPLVRQLLEQLEEPLCTTSIHDSDEILEYTIDPVDLAEELQDKVGMVIDGGYGRLTASTIVDLTGGEPEIMRQGIGELTW